ncbi:lipocalin family protein [Pseudomonas sp. PDM17]|uniref:lipocalin family protein n=1 Tax=Pseudomonas sp. PDM17 TaxID=2769285 RepID=UPI00177E8520|nr:lipocalin family protein [Pseudomonas sp. PDM17]MBD9501648.1 lipocalin family protein [Pseudomonas sp. PDM17]
MRRYTPRSLTWLACLAALSGCAGSAQQPPQTVQVDFKRYEGTWYELARKPMFFQRHCAQSEAHYRLQDDASVAVTNRCLTTDGQWDQATGRAEAQVPGRTDKLWVRFDNTFSRIFPGLAKGDYWVLYVDDDYQTALVGNPNREYLWLLSRQPVVPDATRMKLLELAHERGYQTDDLIWRAGETSTAP